MKRDLIKEADSFIKEMGLFVLSVVESSGL